jgi:hypothetical protein
MSTEPKRSNEVIDWSLTTWEGAAREQQRRWAALPLESVLRAQEEMRELAEWLGGGEPQG